MYCLEEWFLKMQNILISNQDLLFLSHITNVSNNWVIYPTFIPCFTPSSFVVVRFFKVKRMSIPKFIEVIQRYRRENETNIQSYFGIMILVWSSCISPQDDHIIVTHFINRQFCEYFISIANNIWCRKCRKSSNLVKCYKNVYIFCEWEIWYKSI